MIVTRHPGHVEDALEDSDGGQDGQQRQDSEQGGGNEGGQQEADAQQDDAFWALEPADVGGLQPTPSARARA